MDNQSPNPTQRRRRRKRRPQGSDQNASSQATPQKSEKSQRSKKRPSQGRSPKASSRSGNSSGKRRADSRQGPSGGSRSRRGVGQGRSSKQPSQWEKFLSLITFGLLGKPSKGGKSSARGKGSTSKGSKRSGGPKGARKSEPAPAFAPAKRHESATPSGPREELTTKRLYVGNLNYDATEHQLEELFRGVGNVISAEVATHSRTQQSKGFAYVEMGSLDEAQRAVETLDNQEFLGRRIEVSGGREEPEDSEGSEP